MERLFIVSYVKKNINGTTKFLLEQHLNLSGHQIFKNRKNKRTMLSIFISRYTSRKTW